MTSNINTVSTTALLFYCSAFVLAPTNISNNLINICAHCFLHGSQTWMMKCKIQKRKKPFWFSDVKTWNGLNMLTI